MKLSELFAAVLTAGLLLSSSAYAAGVTLVPISVPVGTVGPTSVIAPTTTHYSSDSISGFLYDISGVLDPDTTLSLTLTATPVYEAGVLTDTTTGANAPIPKFGKIGLGDAVNGELLKTITISNLTGAAEDFNAYFAAVIVAVKSGLVTISYKTASTVPLPPAALLFVSGLAVLAAFAARRRIFG
jgi:hypothetical protein